MQELRTTTGQRVRISYDPAKNQVTFQETDWFADPIRSTGIPVKSQIVRSIDAGNVVALPVKRKVRHAA